MRRPFCSSSLYNTPYRDPASTLLILMNDVSTATTTSIDDGFYQLLRVNRFSAWVWLAAFGLIALAVVVWAVFGVTVTSLPARAVIEGQTAVLQVEPAEAPTIRVGQRVVACGGAVEGEVIAVNGAIIEARLTAAPNTPACDAQIIIAEQRPIQRLIP